MSDGSGVAACDMTVGLQQRIACVDYVVTVPPGVGSLALHAIASEFASRDPPAADGIRVDLVLGEMPDLRSWQALVSYGPGWSIRQRRAARCLCLGKPQEGGRVGQVACWDGDASRGTVFCAPEYLPEGREGAELFNPAGYPVDQLLLIYYLAYRQGLLVHAAGLVADGRALIFPGVSGAGKSTLTRQFLARGWPTLLSDDRIIVREMGGGHLAFGTPWPGDAGVAVNASAPLAAILFPARGDKTSITALSPQAALERLLPATSILWFEPELLASQLETCERLLRAVPAFELAWSPALGVVDDLLEFVRRL
jgi:hypothetical protein